MIHKFVANDNKGNVNVLEVTSTGTKLGKVAPPVEDTDVATKKYVDDNTGANNKFIVTLTPTAPDYSGTMDKTVAEINAAYEAGQEIVFRVLTSATEYVDIPLAFASVIGQYPYMNFGAYCFYPQADILVVMETEATDTGTKQTYYTTVYTLTPAS